MTEQLHAEPEGELTVKLETMGVEDRTVDVARTLTMRPDFQPATSTPRELLAQLPNLLDTEGTDALPELDIKGTIGEGGMGRVELAEQMPLGREVAVKKVRQEAASERTNLVLLREGWTTGRLEHPNIVPVHTLGRDDEGAPAIVMKKISGTSWLEIIDDPDCAPDAFDADEPLDLHVEILLQICNAVHYAHSRGIIHRDLKPENVMLGEFGEVYLLDWGIAVSVEPDPSGRLKSIQDIEQPAGTPAYMAPEMVEGGGSGLGVHSDIFLLGATLYEALAGHPPYDGKTLYQIMVKAHRCDHPSLDDSVPPELRAICRRAMAPDPGERFENARQMRSALLQFRDHRQSRRLAATGDARLRDVEQLLERERNGEDIDERQLYRTFGECRFAYEQALEINPDNRQATTSLQQALETMAERALQRDAYKAASLLVSDLPKPSDELQKRLEKLEQKLDEQRRDYEQLQKMRREMDVDVGRRGRVAFIAILGGLWLLISSSLAPLLKFDLVPLTHGGLFTHSVVLTVLTAAVMYLGRDLFFANEIDRRILFGALTLFCGTVTYRGLSWLMHWDYHQVMAVEMLTYGVGGALLAIALDRRLLGAALPFGLAGIAGAVWPGSVFWLLLVANFAIVILMSWLWWPDD